MMNDYVFFDVETPNRRHDRICSIGIVRTDANGKKQYSREILVNPEVGFDEDNMNIHHIAPAAIKGMQSFDDVWSKDLSSVFSDAVLVAHNASFDMSVLGKTLSAYNIEKPNFNYNCTYSLAKRNIPALPDYHLPTVSDYFGIKIGTHHNALDDAMACNDIFWSMMLQWGSEMCCCIPYVWADAAMTERLSENCSQAMTDLYGIAIGVSLSGSIEQEELVGFKDWMVRNKTSQSKPFFRQCYALLEAVLADGRVTNDERKEILALTRPFVMNEHNKLETVAMQQLIGIIRGVSADGKITQRELTMLQDWLEDHEELNRDKSFSRISENVHDVLEDGCVSSDEEHHLFDLFNKVIDPTKDGSNANSEISFDGHRFVLSGSFSAGPKSIIETFIIDHGGEVVKSVSNKVAYVVIGGEECERYAFGNYGTKVKKAMELQAIGKPIQIIQEAQLNM